MTLGELFGPRGEAACWPRPRADRGPCGRQPRGEAGLSVRRVAGGEDRRRPLHRGCAASAAPRRSSCLEARSPAKSSAAIIEDSDPRRRLALIAARFFGVQPEDGGRRDRHQRQDVGCLLRAPALGGAGVYARRASARSAWSARPAPRHSTTPRRIRSSCTAILAALAEEGVTHLALEASSHGLQQRRLDGIALAAGAFTNISRDHLDYHASFEDYFAQKLRLFTELLPEGAGRDRRCR